MNTLIYKYDFELSSKRKIFLWLYQIIPNIDIIKYIYQLKEELDLYENQLYHGLCPKNIMTTGKWIPIGCNQSLTIPNKMKNNVMLMKFIMKSGFICSFIFNANKYSNLDIEEICYGNWFSVIPNINLNPSIKGKIKCINKIFEMEPYLQEDILIRLNKVYQYYPNNTICRIGFDQNYNYYIPNI